MKDKLDFKLTEMNAMPCYIAEPYKVICYHRGQEIPTWNDIGKNPTGRV